MQCSYIMYQENVHWQHIYFVFTVSDLAIQHPLVSTKPWYNNLMVMLKDDSGSFQPAVFPINVAIWVLWVVLTLHLCCRESGKQVLMCNKVGTFGPSRRASHSFPNKPFYTDHFKLLSLSLTKGKHRKKRSGFLKPTQDQESCVKVLHVFLQNVIGKTICNTNDKVVFSYSYA